MSSDTPTTGGGVAIPLSAAAFRVASLAAEQIGVATADWVALAVLAAASEQSGLEADGANDAAGPIDGATPDSVAESLARLEAKLDEVLAAAAGGLPDRPAPDRPNT